jgi:2-hydroxy-6-oxonona-2,4-dienedioate hydrolase
MSRDDIRARLFRSVVDPRLITSAFVEADYRINNSPGAHDAFAALARYYATTIDEDATCERLAKLRQRFPILLLWGEKDASVAREYGEAAHKALPGSRFELVADTAHLPYYERPSYVNELLGGFVLGRKQHL